MSAAQYRTPLVKHLIQTVLGLLLRLVLLALGLVFLVSVLLAGALLLLLWLARALWCKLTGRPVAPWTFTVRSSANWNRFYRAASGAAAARGRTGARSRVEPGDVIDVQPRQARPEPGDPPALP